MDIICVKTLNGNSLLIETDYLSTIKDLKKIINEIEGYEIKQIRLIGRGILYDNDNLLLDVIAKTHTLNMVLSSRGG